MPSEILQFRPEQLQLSDATPLGSGAISHVVQSELTKPKVSIVVKILSKIQLLQQSRVESAMHEKDALVRMGPHPFVARLYGTGQSEDELYFVMEHLPHGDLLQHIRRTAARRVCEYAAAQEGDKEQDAKDKKVVHSPEPSAPPSSKADGSGGGAAGSKKDMEDLKVVPIPPSSRALRCLDFSDVQLITAQLVLGLARVFECGFVLRDFKPENIAFDRKYRAVLIDFDTVDLEGSSSKPTTNGGVALRDEQKKDEEPGTRRRLTVSEIQDMRRRTSSFCGTAQYVSPEMVGELQQ